MARKVVRKKTAAKGKRRVSASKKLSAKTQMKSVGQTKYGKRIDKARKKAAKRCGWRWPDIVTAGTKPYFENRANRCDKDRRKRI
jgi:hypothetical protein